MGDQNEKGQIDMEADSGQANPAFEGDGSGKLDTPTGKNHLNAQPFIENENLEGKYDNPTDIFSNNKYT